MSKIFKPKGREDGPWYADFTISGRRFKPSTKLKNKREAQKEADRLEREYRDETNRIRDKEITVGDAIRTYLNGKDKKGRPNMRNKHLFNKLVRVIDTDMPVSEVTQQMVYEICEAARNEHRSKDRGKPLANDTKNKMIIMPLSAAINYCASLKPKMCEPIHIEKYEANNKEAKPSDEVWLSSFMAEAHRRELPHMAALALFMFRTGTRLTNSIELQIEDVDLEGGVAYFEKTKNGSAHHAILPEDLVRALRDLIGDRSSGRVFGYKTRHSVAGTWNRICDTEGVGRRTRHGGGRHGFATTMLEDGFSLGDVKQLGNWKSERVLEQRYIHKNKERLKKMVDKGQRSVRIPSNSLTRD